MKIWFIYNEDEEYSIKSYCKGAYLDKENACSEVEKGYIVEEENIQIYEDTVYILIRHLEYKSEWFVAYGPTNRSDMNRYVEENMLDEHPNYRVHEIEIIDYQRDFVDGFRRCFL